MSDWINKIVRVEKVEKHPEADRLDIAYVMGDYPIVCKLNQYKVGDLVGYISIESILPDTEEFHFLSPKQYEKYEDNGEIKKRIIGPKYSVGSVPEKFRRLKAKRFFNVYSQGLLINCPPGMNEGDDLVSFLNLKKWEEEEEENIIKSKYSNGSNAEKAPQDWSIPYYDVEGLRKYLTCIRDDEEVIISEKLHGSNMSACYDGNKLWVKSRNFYKKYDPEDPWWDIAIRYDLENKLSKYPNKVFFGELYGQVKNFRYDCNVTNGKLESKIRFFDIWDLKELKYLDYDAFKSIILDCGLDVVPELYRGLWAGKDQMYSYAEGMTTLGGKHIREGFVLRTVYERFEPKLHSRMQLKLVGEGYNLKK